MNILIVGFEDNINGELRTKLIDFIKSHNSWAKLNNNTFAVTTPLDAGEFRDRLVSIVGEVDRLFIYLVNNRYWATYSMPKDVNDWLQKNWSQP